MGDVTDSTNFDLDSYTGGFLATDDLAGVSFTPNVDCTLKTVTRLGDHGGGHGEEMRLYLDSNKSLLATEQLVSYLTATFDYELTAGVTYLLVTTSSSGWYYGVDESPSYPVAATNVTFNISVLYDDSETTWSTDDTEGFEVKEIVTEASAVESTIKPVIGSNRGSFTNNNFGNIAIPRSKR